MVRYLLTGAALGLAAGISPGPMLGLVISQTLRRGWRAGNLVALAPLVSDAPIIVLLVVVLGHLPAVALHAVALLGGVFVVYLGVETVRSAGRDVTLSASQRTGRVLWPAVATNAVNPHPYLFWATVGGATLVQSFAAGGPAASIAFVAGFYALLVGAKLAVAFLVSRSRGWLAGRAYRATLTGSGLLLVGLGGALLVEGAQLILQQLILHR